MQWVQRTTLSGHIFATKAPIESTIGINLLTSNTSSTCPHNMVNFGSLTAEIDPVVWGTPLISAGFASWHWQRYWTALQYWASAKLCGVEQRAPPMFGRAAITLGIGPHSSLWCYRGPTHDRRHTCAMHGSRVLHMALHTATSRLLKDTFTSPLLALKLTLTLTLP